MIKNQFLKKLIIGSANFHQVYGADSTLINNEEKKKIFNLLKKYNISKIDTAESYIQNN